MPLLIYVKLQLYMITHEDLHTKKQLNNVNMIILLNIDDLSKKTLMSKLWFRVLTFYLEHVR